MANQTGIAITIRAFLQTGKTLNEQFEALSIVKTAHETGDYSALLKAATVEDVKTEQKTRRIEIGPDTDGQAGEDGQTAGNQAGSVEGYQTGAAPDLADAAHTDPGQQAETKPDPEADVPAFLRKDKKSKAA